jgi:sodium:sulfate symporter-like transmembrane protein
MTTEGARTGTDKALLGHSTYRSLGEQPAHGAGHPRGDREADAGPRARGAGRRAAAAQQAGDPSFGFMLPVSTPQNAIVYGNGAVPITTMIRSGAAFDLIGAILIIVFLPVMVAVLGLGVS